VTNLIIWLETHDQLAGWAQFAGAILALVVTYLTAFIPVWRRKKALKDEALRLLMHGYEVIESFHRTSINFPPFPASLRHAALPMTAVIEEMSRFPVFELDANYGKMSFARRLMSMRMNVDSVRMFLTTSADELKDRAADEEEHQAIREFVGERLQQAHNLLMNIPMERPVWSDAGLENDGATGRAP